MSNDPLWCVPANRRGFLRLLLASTPGAVAAYCGIMSPSPTPTPTPTPAPSESPSATPTPTPTPTPPAPPMAGGPTDLPAVVRSFGPNGTHWPTHTPWVGDDSIETVDVDCDWKSISQAIAAVTSERAAAGIHIRIRPGQLNGFGASSGSKAVLQSVGSNSWPKNVLVSPLDGWGTVTITAGARLRDVHGVTFARINGTALLLTNCSRTAWAHSKLTTGLAMVASYGATMSDTGAYEVVMSDAKPGTGDVFGFGSAAGSTLKDCVWEGCYGAPVFRPDGSTAHLDTLQMYGSGWYRGLTVRDTTLFGSPNCALQIGGSRQDDPGRGTTFLTVDHSILTSQSTAIRVRYPLPAGVQAPTMSQAINGAGEPGMLTATDSYIFGTMYTTTWSSVRNTRVSFDKAVQNNRVADGSWTYDASMNSWTSADFNQLTPTPSDDFLAGIWS